jgi:hypothetical protein
MSEEQPVFKVTDRRLFNSDGTPREVEREADSQKKADAPAKASEAASTSAAPNSASDAEHASNAASATAASATDTSAASTSQSQARAAETRSAATSTASSSATAAAPNALDDLPEEDAYAEGDIPGADDPTSFINFLMSIASNAAASLGMMEHPVTGERAVDLQLGKHWIDVLGMLQQKTRGNLVPQEQQIFEGLLADLRMQFVSLTNAPQPKAPRGFTGRDIIGGK